MNYAWTVLLNITDNIALLDLAVLTVYRPLREPLLMRSVLLMFSLDRMHRATVRIVLCHVVPRHESLLHLRCAQRSWHLVRPGRRAVVTFWRTTEIRDVVHVGR